MRLRITDTTLSAADIHRIEGCVCLNGYMIAVMDHGHRYDLLDKDQEPDHTVKVCTNFVMEYNREGFDGKIELVL